MELAHKPTIMDAETKETPCIDQRVGDQTHWSPYVSDGKLDIFYMAHAPNSPQKRWGKHHIQTDTCPTLSMDLAIKEPCIIDDYNHSLRTDGLCGTVKQTFNNTSVGNGCKVLENNQRIRKLTERECERLQAFPDDWTVEISMTQRYKCLGNAVTTSVITHLGLLLKKSIAECD
jgi:site-specific DNA-cytosine methylase